VFQQLTEANRITRRECAQQLLDNYSDSETAFIFFTDEKLFTVSAPMNSQDDRVYAPTTTKKRNISASRWAAPAGWQGATAPLCPMPCPPAASRRDKKLYVPSSPFPSIVAD